MKQRNFPSSAFILPRTALVLFSLFFFSGMAKADMLDVSSSTVFAPALSAPAVSTASSFTADRISLLAGPAFLLSHVTDTGASLAMNVRLLDAGRFGVFSLQLGGILPHGLSGDVKTVVQPLPPNSTTKSTISNFSEFDFSLRDEWSIPGWERYLAPEVGVGASQAFLTDQQFIQNPSGFFDDPFATEYVTAWSPYVTLGVHLFPKSPHLSLRVDASYVHYANQFAAAAENLGFSAWLIRPVFQLKF